MTRFENPSRHKHKRCAQRHKDDMTKYFILGLIGFFHTDKISWDNNFQKDWDVLTITKICSINRKQCKDKLTIDKSSKLSFGLCGQKSKPATLESNLIQKITNLNKAKIKEWDKDYQVDSVCGYVIELNGSDKYSVVFDSNPDNYDMTDIKDYIKTLNETFKKIK